VTAPESRRAAVVLVLDAERYPMLQARLTPAEPGSATTLTEWQALDAGEALDSLAALEMVASSLRGELLGDDGGDAR